MMSVALELNAEIRTVLGRSANRRMRKSEGKIPAVVYGAAEEGQSQQVVVRDLQRSPDSGKVLHVDFLRVKADQEINVNIPLRFVNEENCVGVKIGGGLITRNLIEVEISCLPADLPEAIEVDVGELDVGEAIHLSGLKVPDNVTIVALLLGEPDRDISVVSVTAKRGGSEMDEGLEAVGQESDQVSDGGDSDISSGDVGAQGSDG